MPISRTSSPRRSSILACTQWRIRPSRRVYLTTGGVYTSGNNHAGSPYTSGQFAPAAGTIRRVSGPRTAKYRAFALTAVRPDGAPAPHTESPFLANLSIEPIARTLGDAVEKTGGMPVIFSMT